MIIRRFSIFVLGVAAALVTNPAMAQTASQGRALIDAVKDGDGALATQLLASNPTLINSRNFDGETPLLVAIKMGKEDWAGYLINKGADVNAANRDGDTPLIIATRNNSADSVSWLLGKKARVDLNNKIGETALILAVQSRNVTLAERLLAAGADPDKADFSGHSARDYAKRDDRSPRMLKLFEKKSSPAQ